jgi:hypothetical protein
VNEAVVALYCMAARGAGLGAASGIARHQQPSWKRNKAMVKLIFLLKRKPGISKEQFREHYENTHVLLAHKYIGHLLTAYRRFFPTFATLNPSNQPASGPVPIEFEYDAITEMEVADEAAVMEVQRIFNDPEISPILAEDERKFLDRESTVMLVVDHVDDAEKLKASRSVNA